MKSRLSRPTPPARDPACSPMLAAPLGAAVVSRRRLLTVALLCGVTTGLMGLMGCPAPIETPAGTSFLYVGSLRDRAITTYRIGSSGALTPLDAPPTSTRDTPLQIAISANQKVAYVAEGSQIQPFTLGPTGTMTPLASVSVTTGVSATQPTNNGVSALTADTKTSGGHLYAISNVSNASSLLIYKINADGTLTAGGTKPLGSLPNSIAQDDGYVYVTDNLDNTLSVFAKSGDDLNPLSPATYTTQERPIRVVYGHNSGRVYVSCQGSSGTGTGSLMMFRQAKLGAGPTPIGRVGTQGFPVGLAAINTQAYATGLSTLLSTTATGRTLLFTPNLQASTVSAFVTAADTENVTPLSTPLFSTGSAPVDAVGSPDGKYLYVISALENSVYAYDLTTAETTGVTPLSVPQKTGRNPFCMASASVGLTASSNPTSSTTGDLHAHVK